MKQWRVDEKMSESVIHVMRVRSGLTLRQGMRVGKGEVEGEGRTVCWSERVRCGSRWADAHATVARVEREGCGVEVAWWSTRKASASLRRVFGEVSSPQSSSVTDVPNCAWA